MAENEIPEPSGVGGIVPHFYYDLLGRIIPGAYLLVAGHWLVQLEGKAPALGNSLSVTALVITTLAAYAVSFVLGPCSHWFFDWSCRFGEKDLTNEITSVLDENHISHPVADKKGNFHEAFLKQSELCGYVLWLRAPQLAIICSRWDAEAFTARQIGMVTIVLLFVTVGMILSGKPPDHAWFILCLFLLITVLSAVQFQYSRRKAILARFRMLASVSPQETAQSTSA